MSNVKSILLVDDDQNVRDSILLILESFFDVVVTECSSAKEAIAHYQKKTSFDLIICDYDLKVDKGSLLHKHAYSINEDQKFILFSSYYPNDIDYFANLNLSESVLGHISKPFDLDEMINLLKNYLKSDLAKSKYIRVNVQKFIRKWCKSKVDVYIQLGDEKFVKICRSDQVIEKDILNKYAKKGVAYFYIDREQAQCCIEVVLHKFFERLEKSISNIEEPITAHTAMDAIDDVHAILKVLGMNDKTITVVNQIIDANVKSFENQKELASLIEIFKQKGHFICSHGYLTAYLTSTLVKHFSWHNEETVRKLIAASLFQNLSLDLDELAQVETLRESTLLMNEKDEIIEHPRRSADMMDANNLFNQEVSELIMVHHERPDGSGFPLSLSASNVSLLQALFIFCSHFANNILVEGTDDLKVMAQTLNQKYMAGNYKSICQKFIKLYLNDQI